MSGHNWTVFGRRHVQEFLGQQRDGLKYMHDQTLRLMSHGYVPTEIANTIEFPPALARLWHLRGYYGALKHNVRGIYTYYLGWYDGNPANLDSLPPREMAKRALDYMGGIEEVLTKAKKDFENGDYRWVVHILDQVLWVAPDHAKARELAAAAHKQLGYQAENATWRNAYLSAAQELRDGLPKTTKSARRLRDVVKGMSVSLLLNALSIRFNGPKLVGHELVVNWEVADSAERCHTELRNSVLVNRDGAHPSADTTVELSHFSLSQLVLGEIGYAGLEQSGARIIGDTATLPNLLALLDHFPAWFPIATHGEKSGE